MKSIILFATTLFVYFVSQANANQNTDTLSKESKQVAFWKGKLSELSESSSIHKLSGLWLGLRNMGYRKTIPNHSPDVHFLYYEIQSELLAIPGHAEYYADKLAEARKNTEKPWVDNKYQMIHQQIRETMVHLPSPETIWVVGNMLESKEDMRTTEEYFAIREEQQKMGMQGLLLPNPRKFAYTVLLKIGLRDYEESMHHENSASCLAWWKEIKSGQRTFSFQGQAVEYRFNPDGTWQTIPIANPPDDAPKPPVFEKTESKPERQAKELEKPGETKKPIWVWIITTGLFVGGLLLWFIGKRRAANGNI